MTALDISFDPRQIRQIKRDLRDIPRGFERAFTSAMNRTVTRGAARLRRRLAKPAGLRVRTLGKGKSGMVRPLLANYDRPTAGIRLLNYNIPLHHFQPRKIKLRRGMVLPISKQGEPQRQAQFPFRLSGAKDAPIMVRKGRKRLPIHRLFGLSPRKQFEGAPMIERETMQDLGGELEKNIASQVDRLLKRRKV